MLFGNAITVPAGFFLASQGNINWWLLVWVFIGSSLIIASACVLNNYLDQDIDSRMERTKQRPLITGEVPSNVALIFSILLGLFGLGILLAKSHPLVSIIGIIGFVDYVWLYGAWSKRKSMHGTLVGSISGAIPILAGYVAVSQQIDLGAILVFAILFVWQMPEFYSIAIFRQKEYDAAMVPVITVVKGITLTKRHILAYTVAFVVLSLLLTVSGYTGTIYFIFMSIAGSYWIWLGIKGLKSAQDAAWAKKMFHMALNILLLFCLLISIDFLLP